VLTTHVEQKPMPVTVPAVGTVESISAVEIRAQVSAQVAAVHFTEGQDVQKGQRLFTLDARPYRTALLQAEAVLARDTATLKNARAQQERVENLFKRGLIARNEYDAQRATADAAGATVEADKAAVETARVNLAYTDIRAPIAGRTGALGAHAGDLVRSGDTTPLVTINQITPVYVSFAVPGRYLNEVRKYQAVKPLSVTAVAPTGAAPGTPMTAPVNPQLGSANAPATAALQAPEAPQPTSHGSVSFIDNAVDATTGTIKLKATFPNKDRQLWPGAFVQVSLDLASDDQALVVPAVAVQSSQDGQYVYVVKADNTVEMRMVRAARQQGNQMVLDQGVTAGETVVTDRHLRLTPGARVMERQPAGAGRGTGAERGAGRADARGGR
jgi:multidrug efflux system membrane fusion protein